MILGVVIGHEIVVEVVIATHPHKEDALTQSLCRIWCTQTVRDLIKCALEVLDLLVKRNATNLYVHVQQTPYHDIYDDYN